MRLNRHPSPLTTGLETARESSGSENSAVDLTCDSDTIDIIDASYGNLEQECHAAESVQIVRDACQGKTSCEVQASNGVFGDPCGGTYKYLTVNYQCSGGAAASGMSPIWTSTLHRYALYA